MTKKFHRLKNWGIFINSSWNNYIVGFHFFIEKLVYKIKFIQEKIEEKKNLCLHPLSSLKRKSENWRHRSLFEIALKNDFRGYHNDLNKGGSDSWTSDVVERRWGRTSARGKTKGDVGQSLRCPCLFRSNTTCSSQAGSPRIKKKISLGRYIK